MVSLHEALNRYSQPFDAEALDHLELFCLNVRYLGLCTSQWDGRLEVW